VNRVFRHLAFRIRLSTQSPQLVIVAIGYLLPVFHPVSVDSAIAPSAVSCDFVVLSKGWFVQRHARWVNLRRCQVSKFLAVVLLFSYWFAFPTLSYAYSGSSHSQTSSSHTSKSTKSKKSSASDSKKTVHVKGYYRKDGTYVAPYDRRPPGTADAAPSKSAAYRRDYVADGYAAHTTVQRDKHGKIKRSKSARNAFMRQQPCPSTGKTSGTCPGYVVDHVKPLECGGADSPGNMQWQTQAAAKAKDKTEGIGCR
jgi:hypothetical protein